ncbi:MAG: hypothetical protein Q8L46_02685, partial [candidate division WWE3 bacterium]|nr:hypothetical protein [candidate division WWE3 bacterium]
MAVSPAKNNKLRQHLVEQCKSQHQPNLIDEAYALLLRLIEKGTVTVCRRDIRGKAAILIDSRIAKLRGRKLVLNEEEPHAPLV